MIVILVDCYQLTNCQRKVCWPWLLCSGKFWKAPVQKWASIVRSTLFAVAQLAHGYTDRCTFAWAAIKLCKEDVVTAGPISGLEKRLGHRALSEDVNEHPLKWHAANKYVVRPRIIELLQPSKRCWRFKPCSTTTISFMTLLGCLNSKDWMFVMV